MKNLSVARSRSRGLSLIELMVGVTIGMVCVIVMFQVVNLWENTRRSTTSGSEAQITGSVASFEIERDMKLAGMGFGTANDQQTGCAVKWQNTDLALTNQSFPLAPVVITKGASGAPDTISILHGNSSYFVSNENISSATTTSKRVSSQAGFNVSDLAIYVGEVAGANVCELVQITANNNADGVTLVHASGTTFQNPYTVPPTDVTASPYNSTTGSPVGFTTGVLFNLGPTPRLNDWTVTNGNLQVNDRLSSTTPSVIAEGVVNLKAQYGLVDPLTRVVTWVDATPAPADWRNLKAVRFSLLVRSPDFEKDRIQTATGMPLPAWTDGDGVSHEFVMTDVNGAAPGLADDVNDWRHYRYRVYESTIVMRNMMWATQ